MQEDLTDIINFISLQESKKSKNILKKTDDNEEEEENEPTVADGINLLSPVKIDGEPTTDIQTGPLTDLAKRKYTAQQASKGIESEQRGTAGVIGFVGSSPTIAATRTGFVNPTSRNIADVVAAGRLQRIAASYEPFQNGQENLSENIKSIKRRVLSLLNQEPHKTTINKMRKDISGE